MVASKQHSKHALGQARNLATKAANTRAHSCGPKAGSKEKESRQKSKRAENAKPQTSSRCPVSADCGACQLIDVPYEQQLEYKRAQIVSLFEGLCVPELVQPVLGMDNPFYYRNKVMSPFAPGRPIRGGKNQEGKVPHNSRERSGKNRACKDKSPKRDILCGMYAQGTHRIIDSSCCCLENDQAKQVVQAARSIMLRYNMEPYDEDRGTGFVRHVVVRVGHRSGEVLVTLVTNEESFPSSKSFCRELVRRCPFVTTVVQNINTRQTNVVLGNKERTLYGPGFILDELCGLSFRVSSQSFYQVNSTQTEVLYRTAINMAHFTGAECAIDAYCGTGTIGLVAAANGAARVIGVDSVASSIRDARQNALHNGIENARFEVADAGAFLREQAASADGSQPYILLMDPPRAGSTEEFLSAAVKLSPSRIVYISCNPETQARDLRFLKQHGYTVRRVQPVDMFPHTRHIETVALLTRINN